MKVRVVLFACVLVCVSEGVFAADVGVPAAGAGSGVARRYVEDVDADGLSKFNSKLMHELALEVDKYGQGTLLHCAAFWGDSKVIRALVYWGADLHVKNLDGNTPLHIAAKWCREEAIKTLLLLGSDVAITNKEGLLPRDGKGEIGRRVFDEAYRKCRDILEFGVKLERLFDVRMSSHATDCLVETLRSDRSDQSIKKLLVIGANVHTVFEDGNTALHIAVHPLRPIFGDVSHNSLPNQKVLKLLIHHGAPLFAVNAEGKTAEQVARGYGFVRAADFLAEKMKKAARKRWSPLRAAWIGAVAHAATGVICDVEGGASSAAMCVEDVDAEGLSKLNPVLMRELAREKARYGLGTLLHYAASEGEIDAIRALVYWGADINARDRDGDTPLHKAVRYAKKEAIRMLLLLGADTTIKNRLNQVPRECEGKKGRCLFDEADETYCLRVNYKPLFGSDMRHSASQNLLHAARTYRGSYFVQCALVTGADVVVANDDGDTALHIAVFPLVLSVSTLAPSIKILELLIRHGVPVFAVNKEGKTAEQVARDNGFTEAADFLAREMEGVREGESHPDKK